MTIIDRIFKLIKESNLTAKDFAKKVGVSQGNITDWKTGRAKPSTEALIKIANAYNISIDYLLGLTSYKNPKEALENKLYQLDLSENEFDTMISLLMNEDNDDIEHILNEKSKVSTACQECINLAYDYIDNNTSSINENINKIVDIINSLDRSKIIHNYQKDLSINSKGKNLLEQGFLVKFKNKQMAIFDGKAFSQMKNETITNHIIANLNEYNDDLKHETDSSLDIIKVLKPIYKTVYKREEPEKISKTQAEKELSKIYNREIKITD